MRDHTVADASVRTFLIADIRGYTAFTTHRGDAAASQLAGRFGTVATEAVEAHGGTLVELRGDEALGAFDSPRAALRCAVELQDAFSHETAADPSLPLNVGIGLDAGEAVAVGTGYRGSALNTAARLCSVAGPGQVLATSGLLHLAGPVEGLVAGVPTDMELKGLDGRVSAIPITAPAWESRAHAPARAPDGGSPAPARSSPIELDAVVPLAGRERELRRLSWHWRRARHGHGRVVVVSGPPGIGKTRLAAELAAEAHATHGTVTYLPRGRDLEGAATGVAASDGPTLIVVDDLDAAATSATEAIVPLADACASRAVLLLVIYRLEASPALVSLVEPLAPPGQRLALGPLDLDGVRMIAALYAGPTVDRLPLARILEESGGHPASIHRSAHMWARRVATEHIGVAADLAAAQRHGLRSAEAAIVDEIAVLERADERERLIAGYTAAEEAAAASAGAEATGSETDRSRPAICPYKGLAAFGPMDASYYHGRDRLVSEITARLVGSSFVGLLGASGSGKSSALLAGLLPALATGVLPGSDGWVQLVIRPGSAPLDALEAALARTPIGTVHADAGASPLAKLDATIASRPTGSRLVLVVDQFEELFASPQDPAQRSAFVDLITSGRDGLVTVVAMRADRYADAAAYPALARAMAANQVLVGPMTRDELIAAIERPAQQVGLRVEPGLTAALVDDAGSEPGVLPLLSTALLELWGARDGRRLTLAAYRASGGLHGAVARLAEDAWATLDPDRQARARTILLRLAGPGEGEAIVRRRVPLDEFDLAGEPLLADVIERLTAARLLTADEGHVEVAHEALLREWPRLAGWLEEDSVGRQLRLQLTSAARTWDGGGRERGDLYRGARLSLTLDEAAEHPEHLSPLERAFLDESRAAAAREAEDQRRTNRRLRLLVAGLASFLLVAVSAGFLAAREASRADRAADVARSRELAAAAIATLDDDPSLSKLLALQAASAGDPPLASIAALHTAYALDRIVRRIPVADTWTDVDPGARWLAVSSDPGEQRDAFEVLDLESAKQLWRYAAPPGATVSAARFLPDGQRLVAGVRAAAPDEVGAGPGPAGGRPPAQALGIGIWSAGTGELLDWIEMGECGTTVRDATDAFAVVSSPTGPDCTGTPSVELVGLGSHERRTLTGSSVNESVTIDQPSLSRDGRFVAFSDPVGGRTIVADTSDLAAVLELPGLHEVRALSRDGSLVALGPSPVEVWDVASGARLTTFAGHGGDALHVEFLPWADTVMSTGVDRTLRWWDPRTGRQLDDVPAAGNGRPTPIGRDRVGMSSAGSSEYVVLEAAPRGEVTALDLCADVVPRGTFAVAGGNLDVVHGQVLTALTCEDRPWWTASSRLVDLTTGRTRYQIDGSAGQQQELSPDGTRFARLEGTPDGGVGTVSVRDLATGEIVVRMEGLCSWDQNRLASDPSLTAEETGVDCRPFPDTQFPMWTSSIRWSSDGKWLEANDAVQQFSVIWRAETGELVATIPRSGGDVRMLLPYFTSDGSQLLVPWVRTVAGEAENVIDVYSTGTWEKKSSVTVEGDLELGIAPFGTSPDGTVLYAIAGLGTFGGKVQLVWLDPRTLQPVGPQIDSLHDGQLKSEALAPDGLHLATGSADGVVRIWDLAARRLVHEVDLRDVYPGQQVQGLAWVDDGHLAAILSAGQLTVLTTDPGELLTLAHQSLTRDFTPSECDRFGMQPCPVDRTS